MEKTNTEPEWKKNAEPEQKKNAEPERKKMLNLNEKKPEPEFSWTWTGKNAEPEYIFYGWILLHKNNHILMSCVCIAN